MLHVVLATLAPQKHVLALSLPALCADLRALQNLANEIGLAYAGGVECGRRRHAVRRCGRVATGIAGQRRYQGRPGLLARLLPQDGLLRRSNRCCLRSRQIRRAVFTRCGDEAGRTIAESALPSNTSLPDFLLACWQVFLSRMTGRPSVTVGCQFDGRSYAELANCPWSSRQVSAATSYVFRDNDIQGCAGTSAA